MRRLLGVFSAQKWEVERYLLAFQSCSEGRPTDLGAAHQPALPPHARRHAGGERLPGLREPRGDGALRRKGGTRPGALRTGGHKGFSRVFLFLKGLMGAVSRIASSSSAWATSRPTTTASRTRSHPGNSCRSLFALRTRFARFNRVVPLKESADKKKMEGKGTSAGSRGLWAAGTASRKEAQQAEAAKKEIRVALRVVHVRASYDEEFVSAIDSIDASQ